MALRTDEKDALGKCSWWRSGEAEGGAGRAGFQWWDFWVLWGCMAVGVSFYAGFSFALILWVSCVTDRPISCVERWRWGED